MNKKIKIILIVFTIIMVIIIFTKNNANFNEGFFDPSSTPPSDYTSSSTSTGPDIFRKSKQLYSVGPCEKIHISGINIKLAGLLILNKFGNSIFNNYQVKLSPAEIASKSRIFATNSSTPLPTSNIDLSKLFNQTDIDLNNFSCDYDTNVSNTINQNPTNTTPVNKYNLNCTNNNTPSITKNNVIDPTNMFTTPLNIDTTILIPIPQVSNNNLLSPTSSQPIKPNVSAIVLILNNTIDNTDMLNSLIIELYDTSGNIITTWKNIKTDPQTNFLRLIVSKQGNIIIGTSQDWRNNNLTFYNNLIIFLRQTYNNLTIKEYLNTMTNVPNYNTIYLQKDPTISESVMFDFPNTITNEINNNVKLFIDNNMKTPTTTSSSSFANVKSNFTNINKNINKTSYFDDIESGPFNPTHYISPDDTTTSSTAPSGSTKPNTTLSNTTKPNTTLSNTTKPNTTLSNTTIPNTTLSNTTKPNTTLSNTTKPNTTIPSTTLSGNIPMTTHGYKLNKLYGDSDKNPQTNIYQQNFDGTSNVYSPYIYHSMESFSPLNLYEDKLAPY